MKVSLILCTKNGGERLKTCLRHIEQLDADRSTQVLLVDNGSTDGHSFEYLKQFEAVSRFDCRVLQTFTPGNSAGRNLAIEQAAGELLVFIDDDCYAAPDLLENWIEVFAASDISFGSGMITRADAAYSDLGCNEHPNAVVLDPGTFVQRGFIQGSNMAFRKSCFAAVGLLDERFGAGTPFAGEEWEFTLRASLAGMRGGYFPQPRVAHDHRRTAAQSLSRLLFYDYGAGAVYAKHFACTDGLFGVGRNFFKELWQLRGARARLRALVRGYADFSRLEKGGAS
jgi:GT2 family glycosyltransferase